MEQARPLRLRFAQAARHADRTHGKCGKPLVGKAHRLQSPQPHRIARQAIGLHFGFGGDDRFDLAQEPWVVKGDGGDVLNAHAFAEGLADLEQPVRRAARQCGGDHVTRLAFQFGHAVEAIKPGFQPAQRLLHRFGKTAANRHHLTNRFHRGRQVGRRALELFESKARDFGDDVIDSRFKAGRGCPGDLVGELIQRIAHRQLGRDAGDGEAGGLGRQRG